MPQVAAAPASEITRKIMIPRGQRVLLDADLAEHLRDYHQGAESSGAAQ